MAAMDSRLIDFSSEEVSSATPSPTLTTGTNTPRHETSPSRNPNEAQRRRQQRHSKKLSLSFPILLPVRPTDTPESQYTASPTILQTNHTMNHSFFLPPSVHTSSSAVSSSITSSMPLTPPSEEEDSSQVPNRTRSKSKSHARQDSAGAEFLTVLAAQERRVLELKEELLRAESELLAFKKQWALYEAGKKKNETKGAPVRMEAAQRSHTRGASVVEAGTGLGLSGIDEPINDDKLEEERERRRELARERMMGRLNSTEIGQATNGSSKKSGQRVFSSSRHTRTLSLLTAANSTRAGRTGSLDGVNTGKASLDSLRQNSVDIPGTTAVTSTPSISRTNSGLEGLNLGKTYKDLANAASRKNLPPALSPEQFVKQGRQMVDGVRDGLWNFFEDIRQATVGDEAINGDGNGVRRQNSTKTAGGHPKLKRTTTDSSTTSKDPQQHDSSFWKEFGMDTPKSDKVKTQKSGTSIHTGRKEKRPSLPGRWPSSKIGEDFNDEVCPKHGHGHHRDPANPKPKSKSKLKRNGSSASTITTTTGEKGSAADQHHESKSSTDSRKPPSLISDEYDDDNNDGWDNWDSGNSNVDVTSPKHRVVKAGKTDNVVVEAKEVQWHDLMA